MLSVALVGADGAGKSAVTGRLVDELPVPARRMYLGANPAAATHALPTARAARMLRARSGRVVHAGGPPALVAAGSSVADVGGSDQGRGHRLTAGSRSLLRAGHQIIEESYQQVISRWHLHRGRVVLCDRFPVADHFAHDLASRPELSPGRRLHGAFLRRFVQQPDLVVVLDAEPAVLHARKGEGTLAELASRRDEYLRYARSVDHAVIIDASQPLERVVGRVREAVLEALGHAEELT